MSFKQLLENMEHHFEPGGKYAKYYALFEAAYTLFYTPGSVTRNASHVRDALDLKRMMIMVWLAVFPAMFWGMYNVGNQAIAAIAHMGSAAGASSWQYALATMLGASLDPAVAGIGSKML
ncbi:MAG: RnfABCDGE type electron transport complex subunit D, partial [Aeromonas veronii]